MYGAIAAANALSDCYAMGGRPVAALCVAGFPNEIPKEWIQQIFEGGFRKIAEAGAVVAGGHTVRHSEPMFGFSITGIVDPAKMITNERTQPGDLLYLTKPVGCGPVTTGVKRGKTKPEWAEAAMHSMAALNARASEAAVESQVTAATDITGFGFLGHAANVGRASNVTMIFDINNIPLLDGAAELARDGVMSGGAARNRVALEGDCDYGKGIAPEIISVLLDSETSGGLLLAIPRSRALLLEELLKKRGVLVARVGEVGEKSDVVVRLR